MILVMETSIKTYIVNISNLISQELTAELISIIKFLISFPFHSFKRIPYMFDDIISSKAGIMKT